MLVEKRLLLVDAVYGQRCEGNVLEWLVGDPFCGLRNAIASVLGWRGIAMLRRCSWSFQAVGKECIIVVCVVVVCHPTEAPDV